MIIAYTGLPGGGKSLSAISDYVLPQLAKGRHVFCNIAGLNPMLIACRLGVSTSSVNRLLHRFSLSFNDEAAAQSRKYKRELWDGGAEYFNADGSSLLLDDVMRHNEAVFILDECHEYLAPENYRALGAFRKYLSMARHYGHDLVLITQHIADIWEPLRNRIHETHNFARGVLGLKTQYKENVYYGWNVFADPGYSRMRANDKSIYPLYSSHDGGAKEHMGYVSIWRNRKFQLLLLAFVAVSAFSAYNIFRGVAYVSSQSQPAAAHSPAPEHRADANVIYVKYVVCGAVDCKATRPDGSVLTLPLDYASGKYPIEVKKYVSSPSSFGSSLPGGARPAGMQDAPGRKRD